MADQPGAHAPEEHEAEPIDVQGHVHPKVMRVEIDILDVHFDVTVPHDGAFSNLEFAVQAFPEAFRAILEAAEEAASRG